MFDLRRVAVQLRHLSDELEHEAELELLRQPEMLFEDMDLEAEEYWDSEVRTQADRLQGVKA